MALQKQIELEDGVVVNYHRIVSINKITNINNIIEVASYISSKKRQEEKDYYELKSKQQEIPDADIEEISMNVFIDTNYINKEYDESETIQEAYDYLKATDKYKNAEDV